MMQFFRRFVDYPKPVGRLGWVSTHRRPITFDRHCEFWRDNGRLRFMLGFGRVLSVRHYGDFTRSDTAIWAAGFGIIFARHHV